MLSLNGVVLSVSLCFYFKYRGHRLKRNAGVSPFIASVLFSILKLAYSIPLIKDNVKKASDIFSYLDWLSTNFGNVQTVISREAVWRRIFQHLPENRQIIGIELGVAHGYMTEYWLGNFGNKINHWHGFDSFRGLPEPWRNYGKGAFDNGGKPPEIDDCRLQWHVGDVASTVSEFASSERRADQVWLVLFDLDLYEPSAKSWQYLEKHFLPGDLIYFDEAFDEGERKVINDLVLPRFKISFLAASSGSLAFEIVARLD